MVMFVNKSGRNKQSLQRIFHRCFLPCFGSFDQEFSEEKIFQKFNNQKQELPLAAMFANGSGQKWQSLQSTCHRCFLYQILVHLAKRYQRRLFLEISQSETRITCGLLTHRDKMKNLYQKTFHKCLPPSFTSFGQAFRGQTIFINHSIRNKN